MDSWVSLKEQDTSFCQAISPEERLAITLRYLVTGDFMQTNSFSYHVGHSTVCGIIDSTCDALWSALLCDYMPRPFTPTEWKHVSRGFEQTWNFPHCVRAIDGKHVVIQAPSCSGSTFYNYKGTHSIVLMAMCDAHYCFILLDVGDAGRHSDGGVFMNSAFGQAMEAGTLSLPDVDNITGIATPIPYFFCRRCCLSSEDIHVTSLCLPTSIRRENPFLTTAYLEREE